MKIIFTFWHFLKSNSIFRIFHFFHFLFRRKNSIFHISQIDLWEMAKLSLMPSSFYLVFKHSQKRYLLVDSFVV